MTFNVIAIINPGQVTRRVAPTALGRLSRMRGRKLWPSPVSSSPSPSVGVCSGPCRRAAKIGSVPTGDDGGRLQTAASDLEPEGGQACYFMPLQSLSYREGYRITCRPRHQVPVARHCCSVACPTVKSRSPDEILRVALFTGSTVDVLSRQKLYVSINGILPKTQCSA